jgi:hypothetical protein
MSRKARISEITSGTRYLSWCRVGAVITAWYEKKAKTTGLIVLSSKFTPLKCEKR